MQGASYSTENKWNSGVLPFFAQYNADICLLQECGAIPASAILQTANVNGIINLNLYTWGTDRSNKYILFYPADPRGNRCNLAVVSNVPPTNCGFILSATVPTWRPIIGVVIGGIFFGSIHAISPNGPDAQGLLNQVAAFAGGIGIPWVVGGDYNRLPGTMAPFGWIVNPPNYPTYPATAPLNALDFSVKSVGTSIIGRVLALQMSDHLPVSYTY